MENTFKHLGIDYFLENEWKLFSIISKGKKKERLKFYTDYKDLKIIFKNTEYILNFINSHSDSIDSIINCLENLPDIEPLFNKLKLNFWEIFDIKKFLYFYKKLSYLTHGIIKFKKRYELFFNYLNFGQKDDYTFEITSNYSKKLRKLRGKSACLRKKLRELEYSYLQKLSSKYNISMIKLKNEFSVSYNDNIFKKIKKSKDFDEVAIYGNYSIFYVKFPKSIKKLKEKLAKYREKEYIEEQKIIKKISNRWEKIIPVLKKDFEQLIDFEFIFSRAYLAKKLSLIKPKKSNIIKFKEGIFIPLKRFLDKRGLTYTPISFSSNNKVNIILGSNMGGKTQALKTIGFLQALFQLGFFVPARSFSSKLFSGINFLSMDTMGEIPGLSSFGAEIVWFHKKTTFQNNKEFLYLIDEFARTTNYLEAKALNIGLCEYFNKNSSTLIITTHLDINIKKAKYFLTGGLKSHIEFKKYFKLNFKEKLKFLNTIMDYKIYPIKGFNYIPMEALKISHLMGLPEEILKKALNFLKSHY